MAQLSRRLSPISLFMLSLNGIIGSGWLFAPFYAAQIAGPAAILSWIIAGSAAILIALTFAELSTLFPVAGGTAHIPRITHGTLVSFILSWLGWLTTLMLTPIEVQAVLQYASMHFPALMMKNGNVASLSHMGYLWAILLMLMLSIINIASYRGLLRFNFILFSFKIVVILITIFTFLFFRFEPNNFIGLTESTTTFEGWKAIFSAIASGGIVVAFNGFKSGVELAGESNRPAIAIPISTAGAVLASLLIYLGLQICFIGALDPKLLQGGRQALNYSGGIGPFLALAAGLGLMWLLHLIYINAVISPLGAGLIYVTSTARILYAMSEIGYVPQFISTLNRQKLPIWAIIINFSVGMMMFLPFPGWQSMVNFLVSAIAITYAMGPLGLIALRHTMPDKIRPFKLPMANFLCFLAFYCCNLFAFWTGWETLSKLGLSLLFGAFLLLAANLRGKLRFTKDELLTGSWFIYYLIGLMILSYLSSFGGKGLIPFGWDFLIMGAFTLFIYVRALNKRMPRVQPTSLRITPPTLLV